jgi:signal peptidase I
VSKTTTARRDERAEPSTAATRWRWLDGPAELARPGTDATCLAAALTTQVRAALSYGSWSCVLQWRDERAGDTGAAATDAAATRRYELSFWVDAEPPRPGAQLGPPGEFVSRAALSADPRAASAAQRDAVSTLLADAAQALDARAAARPARAVTAAAGVALTAARAQTGAGMHLAPSSLPRRRRSHARRGLRRVAVELALAAVVVVVGLYGVQAYVIRPYVVPSSSMASTLARDRHVLVDRLIYRLRPVARGDIVVFRRPTPASGVLIERVVGLPGDVLTLRAGRLYVNGAPADVALADRDDGVVHPLVALDRLTPGDPALPWSLARPYRVPAGRYFVLGDGRAGATDSRSWGPLPRSAIIGQAFLSFSAPDHIHAY